MLADARALDSVCVDALILDRWTHTARTRGTAVVVPDGCRDLIVRVVPGERPVWSLTALDDHTHTVAITEDTRMVGLRMHPGVHIDAAALLAAVNTREPDIAFAEACIHEHVARAENVVEVLAELARPGITIANAAPALGVSRRTLERLVVRETGRPPVFWSQLARVRRAARAVRGGDPLAQIAFVHGFTDQAHLARQFRRWLGATPRSLREPSPLDVALAQSGYP